MAPMPVNALSPHISLVNISAALSCACMYILKLNQAALDTNCTALAKKDHVLVVRE